AEEAGDPYVFGECCVSNARDLYGGARIERHRLGDEPPDGAIIYAWFPRVPTKSVALSILGPQRAQIRMVFDTATDRTAPRLVAGLNRFNWNLRYDSATVGRTTLPGRKAPPGTYQVKLT